MIRRVDIGLAPNREPLGNPTPLGLIGLAIACGALTPIAFGLVATKPALMTAAMFAVLFGAGCQLLSGLMNFVNKNSFGGTIFTAFSFLWMFNAWSLYSIANGEVPDHTVGLATEIVMIVIFAVLTYGFGFFSRLLFFFLLDIDLLFACRIIKSVTHTTAMDIPIAVLTVLMGGIALWLAFATLINPVANRQLFSIGGPYFFAAKKEVFDWKTRFNLFNLLYKRWQTHAFRPMPYTDLKAAMKTAIGDKNIDPELFYLQEFGYAVLEVEDDDPHSIRSVRLNAQGIDLHEQLILKKYDFGV
jgi:hypothetical protein